MGGQYFGKTPAIGLASYNNLSTVKRLKKLSRLIHSTWHPWGLLLNDVLKRKIKKWSNTNICNIQKQTKTPKIYKKLRKRSNER
jgi:hypothetical protein